MQASVHAVHFMCLDKVLCTSMHLLSLLCTYTQVLHEFILSCVSMYMLCIVYTTVHTSLVVVVLKLM